MNTKKIIKELDVVLDEIYKEAKEKGADEEELDILDGALIDTFREVSELLDEYDMYDYIANKCAVIKYINIATRKKEEFNLEKALNDIITPFGYKYLNEAFMKVTEENKEHLEDLEYHLYEIPF